MQIQKIKPMTSVACAVLAISLLFLAAGRSNSAAEPEKAAVSFNFRLPVNPGADTAPFFSAALRYWPRLGLHATILPGKGSASSVQSVGQGTDQMGLVDFAAAINGIRLGVPITIIAAPASRDPSGVIFTKASGIRGWADLKGQRIGSLPGAVSGLLVRGALKRKGIDSGSMDWQNIPPGSQAALIKAGTLKVATAYAGGTDLVLSCGGIPSVSLRAYDAGIQSMGQVIIVNNDWESKVGGDVVAKALQGAIEGYTLEKGDPEQAVQDVAKLSPSTQVDMTDTWAEFDKKRGYMRWWQQPLDESRGFAWIDRDYLSQAIAALEEAGVLKAGEGPNVSSYFTTKYLEHPAVQAAAQDWIKQKWAPVPENVRQQCGLS